jgi:copper chaperone CopZ
MNKTNLENFGTVETKTFGIDGMTCDNCVRRVEKALRGVAGVKSVAVDRQAATATVTYDNSQTDIPELHDAVLKQGYKPSPAPAA